MGTVNIVNYMVDPSVQTSMEVDTVAPVAVSCDPGYNAVNVESNKTIILQFNENITMGTGWIELKNRDEIIIPVTVSISGNTLTITPTNPLTENRYTLIGHEGSVTDLAGNPVQEGITYFSTGTSPLITNVTPFNGETNVDLNKNITITFNEPVQAGNLWFELYYTNNGTNIQVPINTSINGNTLTITPLNLLIENRYTLVGHEGSVTDLAGNPVPAGIMEFITGTSPLITNVTPFNGETNVALNKNITITFNEPVQAGNLWFELYYANNGTNIQVPINTSINGNTLTITPLNLLAGNRYILVGHEGSVTDLAGNPVPAGIMEFITTINDTIAPNVTANLVGGVYNTTKTVTLTASDIVDVNPLIYYSTDNGVTWNYQIRTAVITLNQGVTNLKFCACDSAGNTGVMQDINYTIDLTAPTVWASLDTGLYSTPRNVTLGANDNLDSNPQIYYTLNGTAPTNTSTHYTGPLNINNTTTLKFMAMDNAGNGGPVNTVYYIFACVGNINTGRGYSGIQAAVADGLTLNGHVIVVAAGTYTENVVINKNLTIKPFNGTVTLQASNSQNPVITINQQGNGTTIQGLVIRDGSGQGSSGIYLNGASDCTIKENTITGNYWGINAFADNITVQDNIITGNSWMGINLSYLKNAIIMNNYITNNDYGIHIGGCGNVSITGNQISGPGRFGINPQGSNVTVNYNQINGFSIFGIVIQSGSLVNVNNNWWGTNSPFYFNSSDWPASAADVYVEGATAGSVDYQVWCSQGVQFTRANIVQAAATLKTYIETNHTIPISVNITGTQISMPQFLQLATQAVLNINRDNTSSIFLNFIKYSPVKVLESASVELTCNEYLYVASSIQSTMNSTGFAPNYESTPNSLISFESLVYMYSHVLSLYNSNQTLPGSVIVNPWLAVINPNATYNFRTGEVFTSIQAAINDADTQNGDTITLGKTSYTENIVINKNLNITPLTGNITVNAANTSIPVFTINSGGSGSTIMNLIIKGSTNNAGIYINNSNNNTLYQNNITGNLNGIYLNNATSLFIACNVMNNNTANGIYVNVGSENFIYQNTLKYNVLAGISINNSINNSIISNDVNHNLQDGICLYNSPTEMHFNQIMGNTRYGLYNVGNITVNATNNWWGTNNPQNSTNNGSEVNMAGGIVLFDPYLVLELTGSTIHVTKNSTSSSQITADVTHNNHGDDTSTSGTIPDGMPLTFTATLPATITSSATIKRGKAAVTLTSSSSSGATTVAVTLNNQTVFKTFRKSFSTIQSAINNSLTVNGDVILVENGTYTENVVVNKNLTIISDGNVTVQASNTSQPVIRINSMGSGTVIAYFKISNAANSDGVYLDSANDCIIYSNNITGNWNGIRLEGSVGNIISYNSLLNNEFVGMSLTSSSNTTIIENNITDNSYGISSIDSNNNTISRNLVSDNLIVGVYIANSNDKISENSVTYNYYGIYFYESANNQVHFNQIFGNYCGLVSASTSHLVNATNNWWGNNTLKVISTDGQADISIQGGNVDHSTYLVLTVSPTSYKVANGRIYESIITADLTYNNMGEDTSLQGCVPDGMVVHFVAQYGTIPLIQYTSNGKASSTLVLNQTLNAATGVIAVVDNAGAITSVEWAANANIIIMSGAIDQFTNKPLNITYAIPLNESATWISVLWKNTGLFHNEVDLIVDGNVVLTRNVVNSAYLANQNNYPLQVFNQTLYLNGVFLSPLESNIYLQNFIKLNPQYQNYTKDQLLEVFLARIKQQYSFTDDYINFIRNNRNNFTDSLFVLMTYPGDAAEYLTLENSNTNETLSFIKPGDVILRESPMIYYDGYTEDGDAGYEGVRSFAIATTKVTNSVVQYWLDRQSLYAPGAMKAAYGTFLTSLLVIKCHDMVADQAATAYNVTWTRTTPVVVSCLDDAKNAYITGESSLRMGMDVNGTMGNVWAFRFACSSAFSPIEYCVAGDSTGLSVTLGLGERILNGELPELFMSNGYLVYKIQGKSDLFLLLDPVTGIVTDCALGIHGVYCFHDQITDNKIEQAQNLTSNDPNVWPVFISVIGSTAIQASKTAPGFIESFVIEGISAEIAAALIGPVLLDTMVLAVIENNRPELVADAERNGLFNTADYYRNNNALEMQIDVIYQAIGRGGPPQGVWDESYEYSAPNVRRNLEDINNLKKDARALWDGIIELFLPDDREPTLEEVGTAFLDTVTLYLDDDFHFKQSVESKNKFEKNMKILTGNGDDGDPLKQYEKLGMALGVALLAGNYSQAIQIVIIGGLCAIGESIAETLSQKEKAENMTNNTNNTGG